MTISGICLAVELTLAAFGGPSGGGTGVAQDFKTPAVDWSEVLGSPQGAWAMPLPHLRWREDLRSALLEARSTGRALFVTLRCLPCKQCADFDRDVLDGGPDLDPLLRQFITVRLTDARMLDLAVLPGDGFQDYDLSWWGFFLSPQGRVYGIFGGRDEVSESTRISKAALVNTMRRVLDHHSDPRRAHWNIDGPPVDPKADPSPPSALPGYESWARHSALVRRQDCLHCHQIVEILRQPRIDRGEFDPGRELDIWPLPENIGIVVDRDHGLLIESVAAGSPAAAIGLAPGDILGAAGGRRLFGQADLRGVLHREADPEGIVELIWLRDGQLKRGDLRLAPGWRRTVLHWRISVSQGNIGAHPGIAWAHPGPRDGIADGAMSIRPWFPANGRDFPAFRAGLRNHHVIIAVDGERPNIAGREFMTWFRLHHDPGDEVTLTVLDRGARREIIYRLPHR